MTELEKVPAPAAAPNTAASAPHQANPSASVQQQASSTRPGDQASSAVSEDAAQASRIRTPGRWFVTISRLLCWLGRANVRLPSTVGWLLREARDELWEELSAAARASRDTDPWQALRNATMTAIIVFAASIAGVALANPTLAANTLPSAPLPTEQAAATPVSPPLINAITPTPSCPAMRVVAERLNLRPAPGTDNLPLRTLHLDERLAVLECSDVPADEYLWWRVVGEDGQEGWVAIAWLEAVR